MTKQEVLEKLNKAYDRDNKDYKETLDPWCLGSMHSLDMAIQLVEQLPEIDKNFETILLCAVRYAIGRETYMPSLVIDYITPLLPYLSDNCLKLIADEIIDHGYDGGLGDDMIDRPYWLNFKRKILAEMERRTSGNDTTGSN